MSRLQSTIFAAVLAISVGCGAYVRGKRDADRWYAKHKTLVEYKIVPYVPMERKGNTSVVQVGEGWSVSCLYADGFSKQLMPNYENPDCWKKELKP